MRRTDRVLAVILLAVVVSAASLPVGAARGAPSNDGTGSGAVDAIEGVMARGGNGNLTVEAERQQVEDVYAPGGGAAGTASPASDVGPAPYADLSVPSRFTFQCDAADGCPQALADAAEEDDLSPEEIEAVIQQAFQSLPVAPSPISYQPDGDWAAVNMDVVVYTDTAQQLLETTILDIPVSFRLTPSHWTWDFGDGSPAVPSSQPGEPYPNHTISHVYSSAHDGVTISLTTLWSGQFQIAGAGDWYPVQGFVTTTATAGPVEIVAFDVHLVPNQG